MAEVVIPYAPRELQREYHDKRTRFSVNVCHRRFGKTVMEVNECIKQALTCPLERPRVGYGAPTYSQAKKIAWDYVKHFAGPIPGVKFNEQELRADFPNGARVQLVGADNPDSLRGAYYDHFVADEYQLWNPRAFPEIIRPALADRKGSATFTGTPAGRLNPLYEAYDMGVRDDWYVRIHKASETGYVDQDELEAARAHMSPEQYAQEFECSWDAAIVGSIYGRALQDAEDAGRITRVTHEDVLPVYTGWDLGIGDQTSIWFAQRTGAGEWHLIDFYEASGEPLSHYVREVMERKQANDWLYGGHIFPHDVRARELGTGKSREELLQSMGVDVIIAPRLDVFDGIEAVRSALKRSWIDRERCKDGLESLANYRREYNDKRRTFYDKPVHDWSSHASDALRYLVTGWPLEEETWGEVEYTNYQVA